MKWLLILIFLSPFKGDYIKEYKKVVPIESLKIHYHKGYDWQGTHNRKEINGGKITNQVCEFEFNENKNKLISKRVRIVNELRNFENGNFGKNLIEDSIQIIKSTKAIKLNDLVKIIDQIKDEELLVKFNSNFDFLQKKDIYVANLKSIDFLIETYSNFKSKSKTKQSEFLNCVFSNYEGLNVSSVTEWVKIEFEYGQDKFVLSQSQLGKDNFKWRISKNNVWYKYGVLIPELNNLFAKVLSRKLEFRPLFKEYKNKNHYIHCLN